ncbi:hypothetical protein AXG93_4773s1380 [Marchantia polymorpha subsp. ruderalis]|uniref:Uncharacterized protein n=1 Tax=Marchantia polymorpha subsp. ruderalis TaxID=1480154 RepID=A0A176WLB0_MARPO|nr:hypothetical protein AXG93_4773s1380 [Marchantia polymorpha subsp. ruderalis]
MEKVGPFLVLWLAVCSWSLVRAEFQTFRSPVISIGPGDVSEQYFRTKMPPGHVGIKSFFGEMVEEDGTPVPVSELYLHHWLVVRMHTKKNDDALLRGMKDVYAGNDGICQGSILPQTFGSGSETRHTSYSLPDPYVVEIGNPDEVPYGYEEVWLLNVHGIDTRGAINPRCCHNNEHCAVKEGFQGKKRDLYFQYTVEFLPMEPSLVPVNVYLLDVTDDRTSMEEKPRCKVEYHVEQCDKSKDSACLHEMKAVASLPNEKEVDVVYVNGHLHIGGHNIELRHEDGGLICNSETIYGKGDEAGNEAGYVVGMTACYPERGTQRIKPGEELHIRAVYSSEEEHTGVMGLMYILTAETLPEKDCHSFMWKTSGAVLVIALAISIIGFSSYRYISTKRSSVGYESLVQP